VKRLIGILILAAVWPVVPSHAQVLSPNEMGVALGHFHTIVRDVEATKKFWVLLGGIPIKVDETEVIKFPGVLIFMQQGTASGGSSQTRNGLFDAHFQTTALDHFGFNMKNGEEFLAKMQAAGVRVDPIEGSHGVASGLISNPDGLRLEMVGYDNGVAKRPMLGFLGKNLDVPLATDHLHYFLPESDAEAAQAWYIDLFGAQPLSEDNRCKSLGVDLPGIRLRFCDHGNSTLLPTKGRALDHIGFEVKNLEAFCKKLEASGIKFDKPYSKSRHKSFASAELTDPWGTSIELTEGLDRF